MKRQRVRVRANCYRMPYGCGYYYVEVFVPVFWGFGFWQEVEKFSQSQGEMVPLLLEYEQAVEFAASIADVSVFLEYKKRLQSDRDSFVKPPRRKPIEVVYPVYSQEISFSE